MPRFLAIFASLLLCFAPISGFSLGLGEIDLKSALNQPFDAEIPISSESANDLTALDVNLASAATFAQFGLDRAQFLSDFSFEVVDQAGSAIVLVKSSKPVVEPFVTLLLEISWAQGRLLREYTVLLDPPAFAAESVAPAIVAPAAGPASAPGPTRVVQNESTAQPAAPAPAAPASPASTQSSRPGPVATSPPPAREADSSYGPVRRNDTLWGIAGQYASESVNRNQVMLAIYRANPEAFAGNINRLKAGMILRIPDAAELAGLGRSDAFTEVRRQNEEWRGKSDEGSRLRLVPPPEVDEDVQGLADAGSGAVDSAPAGTDSAELRGRIAALEGELQESRRLIEIRDRELQALQDNLADADEAAPVAAGDFEAPAENVFVDDVIDEETGDDGFIDEPLEADDAVADSAPPVASPDVVVTTTAPPSSSSSFIGSLLSNVWLYVSLFIVLILALFIVRRRNAADDTGNDWTGPAADDEEFQDKYQQQDEETAGLSPPERVADSASILVEEEPGQQTDADMDFGAVDKTQISAPPDFSQSDLTGAEEEPEEPFERTISADSAVNLDQADPIAEADFHMAYGLYDQAAELLTNSLETDADNQALRMKLLEVYFIWENQGAFLQEAQTLQARIDVGTDADWNKVLIMGKQICPDEELFSASPSGPSDAEGIDLAFGDESSVSQSVDVPFDADPDGFGELSDEESDGLDIDFSMTEDVDAEMLDFDMTSGDQEDGENAASTLETPTVESSAASTMETPTIESPAVSSASTMETPTIESPAIGATTMETPTIESPAAQWGSEDDQDPQSQTAEIELDDLGLDVSGLNDIADPNEIIGTVTDEDQGEDLSAETLHIDALDEDTQMRNKFAGVSEETVEDSESSDDDPLDLMLDPESTAEMQSLSGDSQAGDTAEQPLTGDTAEQPGLTIAAELDEDIFGDAVDGPLDVELAGDESVALLDDEPTTAVDADSDSGPAPGDGATMTEVGTKLDLARAYIDMGDPDGAKSILNEVLEEAGDSQRQEAQKLLDDLGSD